MSGQLHPEAATVARTLAMDQVELNENGDKVKPTMAEKKVLGWLIRGV